MHIRVFLVEDLGRTRSAMVSLLRSLDHFTVVGDATNETQANRWLDENPGGWDLAIVDLMLEQGTGIGVVSRCAQQQDRGKVIVYSGYANTALAQRCKTLGADAVIDKANLNGLLEFCRGLTTRLSEKPPGKPPGD